jgi:23S rRNA pseudouridine2605 synthase
VRAVKSLAGMDRQEMGQGQGQGQGRGGKGQHGQNKGQQQQGFKGKPQQGRNGPQQGQGPRQQGGQGGPGGQGGQGGNFNGNKPPRGPMQERAQAAPRQDSDDDFEHIGTIPNPLEQTFDKRFAKGSKRITAGFGRPDHDHGKGYGAQQKGGPKQPDPLQTSVGYIGADAYFGKVGGNNRRGGGGGGGGGGGRGRR